MNINLEQLTDIEELKSVLSLYEEAEGYISSFDWCEKIMNAWYDFGIYEKLGVFLFEITPSNKSVDSWIWIITGDLPSAYIDSSVTTGIEALKTYADLMEDWANRVIQNDSISDCYPVNAEPNKENAQLLLDRVSFIRNEVIPNFD